MNRLSQVKPAVKWSHNLICVTPTGSVTKSRIFPIEIFKFYQWADQPTPQLNPIHNQSVTFVHERLSHSLTNCKKASSARSERTSIELIATCPSRDQSFLPSTDSCRPIPENFGESQGQSNRESTASDCCKCDPYRPNALKPRGISRLLMICENI
jgi:hypothetical protein